MAKKSQYRVKNWTNYNQALVNRSHLTVWISEEALENWNNPDPNGRRGRSLFTMILPLIAL